MPTNAPLTHTITARFFHDGQPVTLRFILVTYVSADGIPCPLVPLGSGSVPIITSDHFVLGWPHPYTGADCVNDTAPTSFEIPFRFPQIGSTPPPSDWDATVTWTGGDQTFDLEVPIAYLAYTTPVATATPASPPVATATPASLPETGGPPAAPDALPYIAGLAAGILAVTIVFVVRRARVRSPHL